MLEILGKSYVIDHVIESFSQRQKERAFNAYVTECLRIITENTAKLCGGSFMTVRFDDVIHQKQNELKKGEITQKIKSKFR